MRKRVQRLHSDQVIDKIRYEFTHKKTKIGTTVIEKQTEDSIVLVILPKCARKKFHRIEKHLGCVFVSSFSIGGVDNHFI